MRCGAQSAGLTAWTAPERSTPPSSNTEGQDVRNEACGQRPSRTGREREEPGHLRLTSCGAGAVRGARGGVAGNAPDRHHNGGTGQVGDANARAPAVGLVATVPDGRDVRTEMGHRPGLAPLASRGVEVPPAHVWRDAVGGAEPADRRQSVRRRACASREETGHRRPDHLQSRSPRCAPARDSCSTPRSGGHRGGRRSSVGRGRGAVSGHRRPRPGLNCRSGAPWSR